jgi:hypothetical protein
VVSATQAQCEKAAGGNNNATALDEKRRPIRHCVLCYVGRWKPVICHYKVAECSWRQLCEVL